MRTPKFAFLSAFLFLGVLFFALPMLVDGDPSKNISDIRRCRLVAKNGTLFKSDAVYAAVGIKPAD
jgi:hypothetical protein